VGLAKFVFGEREYLAAVASSGSALRLLTLHYDEDILTDEGIAPKQAKIGPQEKNRAKRIIADMTTRFAPEKYANERQEKIMKLLEKKAKEKGVVEAPELAEEEGEGPIDLVAVLEKSMRKVKKSR